jgi:hypothetical protein
MRKSLLAIANHYKTLYYGVLPEKIILIRDGLNVDAFKTNEKEAFDEFCKSLGVPQTQVIV